MQSINVLAILLSPLIAVLVGVYLENRKERRNAKLFIFNSLIGNRNAQISPENVRALNLIDVVYFDCPEVRKLWHEYVEMLNDEGLNNTIGWTQRSKKNLEKIAEMAKDLKYEQKITHLDIDRVYNPQGLVDQTRKNGELLDELLRVLKGSSGLSVAPRENRTGFQTPPAT